MYKVAVVQAASVPFDADAATRRAEELIAEHRYLRIDNSGLEAADTAEQVLAWLSRA